MELARANHLLHKDAYRSNRALMAFRFGTFAELLAMALQHRYARTRASKVAATSASIMRWGSR